jgi:peptidoglycan hydrolase CwlO-like protein
MNFIVETLADVAVRQQAAEVRAKRADQRMDRAEQRMDKFERQMKGIQTLVKTGMKVMVDIQKTQKVTNQKLTALTEQVTELAESQRDTDRKFKNWLESMRSNGHKGSNGNSKKSN